MYDGGIFFRRNQESENLFPKYLKEIGLSSKWLEEEKEETYNPTWFRQNGNPGFIEGFHPQRFIKRDSSK